MPREIKINDAKCTELSFLAPVTLAKQEDKNSFLIEAYTGKTVDRWYGSLAIAIDGIKAKKNIPVLMNHDVNEIVGYSKKTYKDKSFFVSGQFSKVTEAAKRTQALLAEGFPWQASMGVQPLKIMSLEKDTTMEVNGATVKGPAEIWLESEVFETSFVPMGADDDTSVEGFSKFQEQEPIKILTQKKENIMDKMTLESLAKDEPDLLASIQKIAKTDGLSEGEALGATKERERILEVLKQSMPGHEALVEKLAFDGKTTGPEAAVQILAAEKKIRENAKIDFKADGVTPVTPGGDEKEPDSKTAKTKEDFEKNEALQKEFGTWETFAAYTEAMEAGFVQTIQKGEK